MTDDRTRTEEAARVIRESYEYHDGKSPGPLAWTAACNLGRAGLLAAPDPVGRAAVPEEERERLLAQAAERLALSPEQLERVMALRKEAGQAACCVELEGKYALALQRIVDLEAAPVAVSAPREDEYRKALEEIATRGGFDSTRSGQPLEGHDCRRIAQAALSSAREGNEHG